MQISRPFVVGLAGGIGSGKSTVSHHLEQLGAHVIDTDVIARELTDIGGVAIPAIREEFGEKIFLANGQLDRSALREIVFQDAAARQALESILHPLIFTRSQFLCGQASRKTYTLLVVPLWVENPDYHPLVQRLCAIDLPAELQFQRIKARSQLKDEIITKMIQSQAKREDRLKLADDVIDNSQNLSFLLSQLPPLHAKYTLLAGQNEHAKIRMT